MDIALNSDTGDIGNVDGDLAITDGDIAVSQRLTQRLRLFLGEWFLGENKGLPFHDEVFVKNPRWAVIDAVFKAEILATEGVVELVSFSMTLDTATRTLGLSFEVRTNTGSILTFDEEIAGGSTSEDSVKTKTVDVVFTNETDKDVSVAAYGMNAQRCDVTVLDTGDDFSDAEIRVTRPSTALIHLQTQVAITKTFRLLIEETRE